MSFQALERGGYTVGVHTKGVIQRGEVNGLESQIGRSLPDSFKDFLVEMGDGFYFTAESDGGELHCWDPIYIEDLKVFNFGFSEQVSEDGNGYVPDNIDKGRLAEEIARRSKWIPFYGFTSSAGLLCFDADERVRFYEPIQWPHFPECWDFILSDSFSDFAKKWSEYCFVANEDILSICESRSGVFDWASVHFPAI